MYLGNNIHLVKATKTIYLITIYGGMGGAFNKTYEYMINSPCQHTAGHSATT